MGGQGERFKHKKKKYDKRTKRDELGRAHFYIAWGKGDIAAESLAKITLDINFFILPPLSHQITIFRVTVALTQLEAVTEPVSSDNQQNGKKYLQIVINPGFLPCRWMLYCLSHQGRPNISDKELIYKISKEFIQLN